VHYDGSGILPSSGGILAATFGGSVKVRRPTFRRRFSWQISRGVLSHAEHLVPNTSSPAERQYSNGNSSPPCWRHLGFRAIATVPAAQPRVAAARIARLQLLGVSVVASSAMRLIPATRAGVSVRLDAAGRLAAAGHYHRPSLTIISLRAVLTINTTWSPPRLTQGRSFRNCATIYAKLQHLGFVSELKFSSIFNP
jgi:hypothetical protein